MLVLFVFVFLEASVRGKKNEIVEEKEDEEERVSQGDRRKKIRLNGKSKK